MSLKDACIANDEVGLDVEEGGRIEAILRDIGISEPDVLASKIREAAILDAFNFDACRDRETYAIGFVSGYLAARRERGS